MLTSIIRHKFNPNEPIEVPSYGKYDHGGSHYGYLVLTDKQQVLYLYSTNDVMVCEDVTKDYLINQQ
jgi:hypothetical protein